MEKPRTERDGHRLDRLLDLTVQLVSSHAGRTDLPTDSIPGVIETIFDTLKALSLSDGPAGSRAREAAVPAVPVTDSVTPDHIICLEDGRPVKLLHRYLKTRFRMSPAEYRRKWGLPSDYPMVAPAYSDSRREHARKVGFQKRVELPSPGRGRHAVTK